MMFTGAEVQSLIDRVGLVAVCSGHSARVIIDRNTDEVLEGVSRGMVGRRVEITQSAGALPLVPDALVTISPVTFRVVSVRKAYDGRLEIAAAEVSS